MAFGKTVLKLKINLKKIEIWGAYLRFLEKIMNHAQMFRG